MEVVNNPDPTIDTFLAEVDEMKKEEEKRSTQQEELRAGNSNSNNNVSQYQPMTTELIQEKIRTGEIIRSEIL